MKDADDLLDERDDEIMRLKIEMARITGLARGLASLMEHDIATGKIEASDTRRSVLDDALALRYKA